MYGSVCVGNPAMAGDIEPMLQIDTSSALSPSVLRSHPAQRVTEPGTPISAADRVAKGI
jgi:hypothetical protein